MQRSDLLILGARFDDRVTGRLESFAPYAKVIHADIDPAEIGKNVHADVPIVGDAKAVITELLGALRRDGTRVDEMDIWWEYLRGVRDLPAGLRAEERRQPGPQYVIENWDDRGAGRGVRRRRRPAPDVGRAVHQVREAGTWLNSGGLGTMGFAIPAAMGAKFGRPEAEVWAIDGDGASR